MKSIFLLIGVLFAFITVSFAEDSDLVKAAKKEKERRAKTEAKKTLTNQDIEEIRKKQPISGIETSTAEGETEEEATGTPTAAEKKAAPDPTQTEEYWRGRKQEADSRVRDAQSRVEQLQSEINTLTQAFYAEGDGVAQRPLIETERIERIKELEAAKQELESARAASEGLEDEARRAGALPGWLRD
jgi:hypothetical protein